MTCLHRSLGSSDVRRCMGTGGLRVVLSDSSVKYADALASRPLCARRSRRRRQPSHVLGGSYGAVAVCDAHRRETSNELRSGHCDGRSMPLRLRKHRASGAVGVRHTTRYLCVPNRTVRTSEQLNARAGSTERGPPRPCRLPHSLQRRGEEEAPRGLAPCL